MSDDRGAVRVYRALIRGYPKRFRDDFGTDLVSLFREQCRDEAAWRVLPRVALDLAITIPSQHLEARMKRNPSPLVPVVYLAVAAAGLLVAISGGSNWASAIIGAVIALGAGTVGVIAMRRAGPVRESMPTSDWWKFLIAGPILTAIVIIAAGAGVEEWLLGVVTILTAFVLSSVGAVLGLSHLFIQRARRIPS